MRLKKVLDSTIISKIRAYHKALIVVVSVILLVGMYVLWSKHTWDEYETKSTGWRTSVQNQVNAALALPGATEKERLSKFTALKEASNTIIGAKDSLCSVNSFVGWQRFIKTLHSREEKCQKVVSTGVAFNEKMQITISYLENEQALTKVISEIPGNKAEFAEGDWEAQATAWHEAVNKVEALAAASPEFAPTKQIAYETIKKTDAAWQEVLAAHKEKDKARYIKAQSQLAATYDSFGSISEVSARQLKTLLDPLQVAYEEAFNH